MAKFSRAFVLDGDHPLKEVLHDVERFIEGGLVDLSEGIEIRVVGEIPGLERVRQRAAPTKRGKRAKAPVQEELARASAAEILP